MRNRSDIISASTGTQIWTTLRLGDGRSVEVLTTGHDYDNALVFHLGTPNAASPFQELSHVTNDAELNLIMYSRPGYGDSRSMPGRSIANAAHDVEQILDLLGYGQFLTIGWSGGGPHALACAALLRDRCRGVATVGSFAPYPSEGLDWTNGMAAENVSEFEEAFRGREALKGYIEKLSPGFRDLTKANLAASMRNLLSPADRLAMNGELAAFLARSSNRALASGITGWLDDELAVVTDWGFDLTDIACDAVIWHGTCDYIVPCAHGSWLGSRIPRSNVHLGNGIGHFGWAVTGFNVIINDLVDVSSDAVE